MLFPQISAVVLLPSKAQCQQWNWGKREREVEVRWKTSAPRGRRNISEMLRRNRLRGISFIFFVLLQKVCLMAFGIAANAENLESRP